MKEYKYQAFMLRGGVQYRFKFFAESKALAEDHARTVARQDGYDVLAVKRMPSSINMKDAGIIHALP